MTKRQIKKQAKNFLVGRKVRARFYTETRCPSTDGNPIITEMFPVSLRLRREINRQAYNMGWSGSHWDSPFIVAIDEL